MVALGRRSLLGLCACFVAIRARALRAAEPAAEDDGFVIVQGWVLTRSDLQRVDL